MGRGDAVVVSGPDGLDVAVLHGRTQYALLGMGKSTCTAFLPSDIGMKE